VAGQLNLVIDTREYSREYIRLEAGRVQRIVLEQLTRLVGFGKRLDRKIAVWAVGQPDQPIF
jgi:hypothetical protein